MVSCRNIAITLIDPNDERPILIERNRLFTSVDMLPHNTGMNRAKSWRLIPTVLIACLLVGCDRVSRKTYQANVALNGKPATSKK